MTTFPLCISQSIDSRSSQTTVIGGYKVKTTVEEEKGVNQRFSSGHHLVWLGITGSLPARGKRGKLSRCLRMRWVSLWEWREAHPSSWAAVWPRGCYTVSFGNRRSKSYSLPKLGLVSVRTVDVSAARMQLLFAARLFSLRKLKPREKCEGSRIFIFGTCSSTQALMS